MTRQDNKISGLFTDSQRNFTLFKNPLLVREAVRPAPSEQPNMCCYFISIRKRDLCVEIVVFLGIPVPGVRFGVGVTKWAFWGWSKILHEKRGNLQKIEKNARGSQI